MQNENVFRPTEDDEALKDLIAMGLVELFFDAELRPVYRLSEAILRDDFTPNAALRERLE